MMLARCALAAALSWSGVTIASAAGQLASPNLGPNTQLNGALLSDAFTSYQPVGADPTGVADSTASFIQGCTNATAAGKPLSVRGTFKFASSATLACDLAFSPGAMLVPALGVVVTLSGHIDAAPTQQIFATPGQPAVQNGYTTSGSPTLTMQSVAGIQVGSVINGPYVAPNAVVTAVGSGTVTMSANATGSSPTYGLTYSFQPVGVVISTPSTGGNQSDISVAWWGALAAAQANQDAAPAIRAAIGSNRNIKFPPATYTIKSLTASPYPPVSGIGANVGVDSFGQVNFTIDGADATLQVGAAFANSSTLVLRYATHVEVKGLHLGAYSATFTGSISGTTLTAPASADIAYGVAITGTAGAVTSGTYVVSNGTCGSGTCTYTVNHSQTVGSQTLTAGLPCCEPVGIQIFNLNKFELHDLYWDGNWGGSTKNPAALGVDYARDGSFHDLHMDHVCLNDTGFLINTHWYSIRALGAPDDGNPATGNANCNFIAVERDENTIGYWPQFTADTGNSASIGNTFGPGIDATNFGASLAIRAGSRYRIFGNDLSNNGLSYNGTGHGIGAGIFLWYDTLHGVESAFDAVSDVTIDGNTIVNNGQAGSATGAICGTATGSGAGIVVDGSCATVPTTGNYPTTAASASGTTLQFAAMSLPGDLALGEVTWTVSDLTTPSAIPGGTTLSSVDLWHGVMTLSASVSGVLLGDSIQVTSTGYEAPAGIAISRLNINGNVLDNNMGAGILGLGSAALRTIGIGINQFSGVNQTTRVDAGALAGLGDAPFTQLGGACNPFFNPASYLTAYCNQVLTTTENAAWVPVSRAGQLRGLQVLLGSTPGAGHSYTFTLRVNGADTSVGCTISGASATSCEDLLSSTNHQAVISKGGPIDLKIVADSSATTPAFVTWGVEFAAP